MLKRFVFYLSLPLVYFLSVWPMWLLYGFSDFVLFPLVYYVFSYRKKVVRQNMSGAFPTYPSTWLRCVERKNYHYICDLLVETLKSFTVSGEEMKAKLEIENKELLNRYTCQNRSVLVTAGHMGNYEWMALASHHWLTGQVVVPYRRLMNPHFNTLFEKMRTRFGLIAVDTNSVLNWLWRNRKPETPYILTLLNDQAGHPERAFWINFLNQDSAFFPGTELISRDFDLPVFFAHLTRPKRGKYVVRFELITDQPTEMRRGEIMRQHVQLLEKDIHRQPEIWLWTHRRWKHKRPEMVDEVGFAYKKKKRV